MKNTGHPSARTYIADLAAKGRHHFASSDAQKALGVSAAATKLALHRLNQRGLIASPARGFYVIVPPEYRGLGCLPADQFIPALMEHTKTPYYVGLLSAAEYHGAAHHRPQQFQVMVPLNRRPIECGKVRVVFVAHKRLADIPVQSFNTPRGPIKVSSPEATAIDLVGYPKHAGGLDNVATVLNELVEKIDAKKLTTAATTAPLPWAQRLGYVLEHLGAAPAAAPLKSYVREHARLMAPLWPEKAYPRSNRDDAWKLYINATVEAEA